jgi:hypothetical protein
VCVQSRTSDAAVIVCLERSDVAPNRGIREASGHARVSTQLCFCMRRRRRAGGGRLCRKLGSVAIESCPSLSSLWARWHVILRGKRGLD